MLSRHLIAASLLFAAIAPAMAQERGQKSTPEVPQTSPRVISVEVAILELAPSDAQSPTDKAPAEPESAEKLLARIQELEKQGKLTSVSRVRLTTVEGHPATAQYGERAAVPSGRQFASRAGGGGQPVTTTVYSQADFGTLIQAVPKLLADGGVLVELQVEKSSLARRTDADDASVPAGATTISTRTVLSIRDGQTVLASGLDASAGKGTAQTVILVTVRLP